MKAYVFPGQGSQKKGMGENLFDHFNDLTAKADSVLGYSIKELCVSDPHKKLNVTEYTQPALYVVNALMYLKKLEDDQSVPDYVAGHSLGEYNALFATGAFDFETGLKLVKKRGELIGKAYGGAMAAVVGLSEEQVIEILRSSGLNGIDIANLNSPSQIVISGPKKDIETAATFFESAKLYMPLNVSGAFHSRYMENARRDFALFLNDFNFSPFKIPVISNVEARPYQQNDIRELLIAQITSSVKWSESIRYLMGKGVTEFEEIGPGKVLTGIIQKIQKEAEPLIIKEASTKEKKTKEQNLIGTTLNEEDIAEKVVGEKLSDCKVSVKNNSLNISPELLGSEAYRKDYGIKYAYCVGGMYRGIASEDMVVKIANAGLLGYFGAGGLKPDQIEKAICNIKSRIPNGNQFGLNLINSFMEEVTVDLLLKYGVRNLEAAAYMDISPALVRYRLSGLKRNSDGILSVPNRIQAKISRPEVAQVFLSPPSEKIVKQLLEAKKITIEEAELSAKIPMAEDLCVEADSGGHTDQRSPYALMPAIIKLRDEFMSKYNYSKKIRVGAAGGIGTPEAACAAFILGADFILTGSINQCTVEAGTSNAVKDLLQEMNVQDTDYAPAGDMFEMGAKVQVLRKGLFFPARANKLYNLYQQFNSLDEIDEKTKKQIQNNYFKRSFNEIYQEVLKRYPHERDKAEKNQKYKMGLIFKWYFHRSAELAFSGSEEQKVDYQVYTGPALGAFNQWVKGTELQDWKNRHVDVIAEKLMKSTAELMTMRLSKYLS